jgi:hypothetical protein
MVRFGKSRLWLLKILTDHLEDHKLASRLLKTASTQELLVIFELAKNILQSNIPISDSQKTKLKKYEKELIFLSEPKKKVKVKVNILLNNKSFLQQLLLIAEEFVVNNYYNPESEEESDESD